MRIAYVAKHDSGVADDEGAIAHALRQLGHEVSCVQEDPSKRRHSYGQDTLETESRSADLLLFHKWAETHRLRNVKCVRAFWYFDQVMSPDPALANRSNLRSTWMSKVIPLVDAGFCTDGDYVKHLQSFSNMPDVVRYLPQGADERVIGVGTQSTWPKHKILYVGSKHYCGKKRESFVQHMQDTYGPDFTWVDKGVYGRQLADLIADHEIVVAPDFPVTDHYCSNRVWMMLGFGAFLLHPYTHSLAQEFNETTELTMYHDRKHLDRLIVESLADPRHRHMVANRGLQVIKDRHLYRHRCEQLIATVHKLTGR